MFDGRRVERHFAGRPQAQTVDFFLAALGDRIKAAHRLQIVAKKIEPHRRLSTRRKQIEDTAALGIFARLAHRTGAGKAGPFQKRDQRATIDTGPDGEFEQAAGYHLARRQALHAPR